MTYLTSYSADSLLIIFVAVTAIFLFVLYRKNLKISILEIEKSHLESRLSEFKAQKETLKNEMEVTFSKVATQSLKNANDHLLQMAQEKMSSQNRTSQLDLEKKQAQIKNIVDPLKSTLSQFFAEVSAMEKERQRSYALVENELKKVVENSTELSKETRALKDALKKPHVRGRWGELQLKNCVELAGMSEFADVSFQEVNESEGKKLIPDMTVAMPGGRRVFVDAKTPLDGFIASLEVSTEDKRAHEMARHGKQVKNHVIDLSRKSYGESLGESADFTIMFLPNESFLYAALETQPDLVEFAMAKKILIATPPTFVGLLKVIRYGWNEDKLAKNAQEISEIGIELHKRVANFVESYQAIGKALGQAQDSYEMGLKRLNSRVLVQTRRMEKLGAKSSKDIDAEL